MEHCIYIIVESFSADSDFAKPKPVATVWGDAWKDDPDMLIWQGNLFVKQHAPMFPLLRFLPQPLQTVEWLHFAVYGDGLATFEAAVNQKICYDNNKESIDFLNECEAKEPLEQQSLLKLIDRFLNKQRRWAVFFARDCDDVKHVYNQGLADLKAIVIEAYQYETEASEGFCSYYEEQASLTARII